MALKTFVDQELLIAASAAYSDGIASPNDSAVAEAQTNLQGDLNVLRTLLKGVKGSTNWYDLPEMTLKGISDKRFISMESVAGFANVATGTGTSSTAFDTVIKTVTDHNDGGGNSTATGVVLNSTSAYKLTIRDHATQDAITDGNNNEVYGRLDYTTGTYTINWYSNVAGTETAYDFTTSADVDLAWVAVSRRFEDISWSRFLEFGFHDVAGISGTLQDDSVTVDGMTFLLTGLTTQAQVNDKLDKLGSTADGEGASGVAFDDAATGTNGYFTGSDLQAALEELAGQIGGTTSGSYDFTENNVLADDTDIYPALEALDQMWGDLGSAATGEGASMVAIEDAGGFTTETTVEGALQEIYQQIEDIEPIKIYEDLASPASGSYTLPGGNAYTPDGTNPGTNMDVYVDGILMTAGVNGDTGPDYQEAVTGGTATTIVWNRTIPANNTVTFVIRK